MTWRSSTVTKVATSALLLTCLCACAAPSAPIAIQALTQRDYSSSLEIARKLGDFDGYSSYAVAWQSDGLRLTAVMNVPGAAMPDRGYPVVVMNHGNANNYWDTFKDYYSEAQDTEAYRALHMAGLITRYAKEGFVVVFPDYRGHGYSETNGKTEGHWQLDRYGNRVVDRKGEHVPRILDNDGLRFGGWLYTAHYTIDVLHLISALGSISNPPEGLRVDQDNLFLWGRSLGGDVTARAMTVSDRVTAASLWVPATMSLWDQAHHYHFDSQCCADGFSLEALFVELQKYNAVNDTDLVARDLDPANFIHQVDNPVLIQVSIDDTGVRSAWGIQYQYALQAQGVPAKLRVYEGDDHIFRGEVLEEAIRADLAFFRANMQ